MKILFWTDGFWPRIGGIETQGLKFVQSLQDKGHECLVIAQKDTPREKEEETYLGIKIRRFDFNGIILKQDLKKLRPIEAYLDWAIKHFQIDIVHLNTCIGWSAFIFSLFRKKFSIPRAIQGSVLPASDSHEIYDLPVSTNLLGLSASAPAAPGPNFGRLLGISRSLNHSRYIPVILTVHAPFYDRDQINPMVAKICAQADHICCVSKWVLQEMQLLIPNRAMRLIYNGLPLFDTPPAPLDFSHPTFLLLGRFTSEKGFLTAIEAFAFLRYNHPHVRLLIAGSGEDKPHFEAAIEKFELQDTVEFTGPLSREEVPHVINRAAVVLVPSHFESFGLTAVEAMQMQRPVIASAVGGLPEIIIDGKTGLLVPPKKLMSLCRAMERLLQAPEITIQMGLEGRRIAKEQFTLDSNVSQYINLYQTA